MTSLDWYTRYANLWLPCWVAVTVFVIYVSTHRYPHRKARTRITLFSILFVCVLHLVCCTLRVGGDLKTANEILGWATIWHLVTITLTCIEFHNRRHLRRTDLRRSE